MPKRGNGDAQRAVRRELVAQRYLRGLSQQAIAAELGVGQATISRDLKALHQQWQAASVEKIDAAKARELARIDELERTYWREWETSKGPREVTTTKRTVGKGEGAASKLEAGVRKEQRTGDPRYLTGVQWCIARRCELLGLDAPRNTELSGRGGSAIPITFITVPPNPMTKGNAGREG